MEVLYLNTHFPTGMSLSVGQVGGAYSEILEPASPPLLPPRAPVLLTLPLLMLYAMPFLILKCKPPNRERCCEMVIPLD